MAIAIESGPARPINMMNVIISLPSVDNFGVTPVDKPTVPKADITSKVNSKKLPLTSVCECSPNSVIESNITPIRTTINEVKVTADALDTTSEDTKRLNSSNLSLPRNAAQNAPNWIEKLVVFIPPPQEVGEAPMNIKMNTNMSVALVKRPVSSVLKPAVLGVTA